MKKLILICLLLSISGCANFNRPVYDPRIMVGPFDSVKVDSRRDLDKYRCQNGLYAVAGLYGSQWYFECQRPSMF